MNKMNILNQLYEVLEDRKAKRPAGSYSVNLFNGGWDAIAAKVMEEAGEFVEAAQLASDRDSAEKSQPIVHEATDLLYHTLVMLAYTGVPLDAVENELRRRFGTSGLEEKASR